MARSRHSELHCTCPLSGVKRTCPFALQMSAFDPKRTSGPAQHALLLRPNLLGFEPTGVVLSWEMVLCAGEISSILFLDQQPLGRCRCAHSKQRRCTASATWA